MPNRTCKDFYAQQFLELWNLNILTKTLPKSGGLLDQDSFYVYLAKHAYQWKNDRELADMRKAQSNMPKR